MKQKLWQNAAWYEGEIWSDRLKAWREAGSPKDQKQGKYISKKEQKWRQQSGLEDDLDFARRLASDEIDDGDFRYLLSQPPEALQQNSKNTPEWLKKLLAAFSPSQGTNIKVIAPRELTSGSEIQGFLYTIEPLISQGIDKLNRGIETLCQRQKLDRHIPFDPSNIKNLLFASLPAQLLEMLTPTMVLELNVARLQGLLSGETPQERFISFLERLSDKEVVLSLLQEYPVLGRQLVTCIENWLEASLEFLERLCSDWEAIVKTFNPHSDQEILVEIKGSISDSHRGGRFVMIVKFSGGLQLVYKPKSLNVDVHFQQLLSWLNQLDECKNWFCTQKIIPREGYGWVEFVAYKSCSQPSQIKNFYQRLGGYLAILYVLEATDFHAENLIACGENPMLVDFESLFHPKFNHKDTKDSTAEYFADSVLRVGLLPQRLWGDSKFEGVDISGIGGEAGQFLPKAIPFWEGIATDEMRLSRKKTQLEPDQNQPRLRDKAVNVLNYCEEIITGFSNIYELFREQKEQLITILNSFKEDEVRVVLRPTRSYALLLQESYHPDVLRNALDRDLLFERLWRGIKNKPYLGEVIKEEKAALWQGDIPMFTTRPNSRDVVSGHGEIIRGFFAQSGFELVKTRLARLNEQDLQRQIWLTKASLTTLALKNDVSGWKGYKITPCSKIYEKEEILNQACAVGDRLELLALGNDKQKTWIGLTIVGGKRWSLLPLGWSLYDGLSGVILFLAYLGHITQNSRYITLAQAGLKTLQHQLQQNQNSIELIGGFSGWGGIIYTFTHLATLWEQPELLEAARGWVKKIPSLLVNNQYFDVVDGAAGCVASLLSLYSLVADDLILDTVKECGEQLLKKSWGKTGIGFAHGGAGVAWALWELANLTKDQGFGTAAMKAIINERDHFEGNLTSWLELEDFSEVVSGNRPIVSLRTTWCNGASGIGLGRLAGLQYVDDAQTRTEIYTSINNTLKMGFGLNHCLCHGDLGNIELLLQAQKILGDGEWSPHLTSVSSSIVESINNYGWLCGVPLGVETPGLMTGLAGIGYGLLRLVAPTRVPSVLCLEPPINIAF